MPLIVRGLIVVGLVAAVIALLLLFDVLSVLREILLRGWQWIARSGLPLFRVYGMRRAMSPFWRVATKVAILVLGVGLLARIRSEAARAGTLAAKGVDRWKALPVLLRWGLAGAAFFAAGFFALGLLIIPLWVPGLSRWTRSVHFWWIDKVGGRWITPWTRNYRRLMRTNPFWRLARRPHRILFYLLYTRSRRGVRAMRGRFGRPPGQAALTSSGQEQDLSRGNVLPS